MSANDRDRDANGNAEDRIKDLKRQAERIAGGDMVAWEADGLSAERREKFWQQLVDFENEDTTTVFQELLNTGVALPDPDTLDDRHLSSALWNVIFAMAGMRVFIYQTNHLSDRELYSQLWGEILREETTMFPEGPLSAYHIDVACSGREGETAIYLKYYADEETRRRWREEFPEDQTPAHEDPPHDRDRLLPKAPW